MRCASLMSLVALLAVFLVPNLKAQVDTQSSTVLEAALKVLETAPIQDVTLTASVHKIAGLTNETDTGTFEALASGSTQSTLQTPTGPLVETRVWSAHAVRTGSWVDQSGKSHALSYHNMMTEPSWFFPTLSLARALASDSGLTVTYLGIATYHGSTVQHLRVTTADLSTPEITSLSQTEFYLDALTMQPVGFSYNDHPDNTALVNIPVDVVFSEYKLLGSVNLPTEIKQYRNNALALEVQVQTAVVNTGLTITSAAQ